LAIGRTPLGKFQAIVHTQGEPRYLGTFLTETEARIACTRFRARHADEVDAASYEQASRTHLQQPKSWRWRKKESGECLKISRKPRH